LFLENADADPVVAVVEPTAPETVAEEAAPTEVAVVEITETAETVETATAVAVAVAAAAATAH
jgi:hypothetical protein